MHKYYKEPFFQSLAVHVLLFLVLIISSFLDRPQIIQVAGGGAQEKKEEKPIIQAGLIDNQAVKTAVARQEQQERDKQKQLAQQKANADKLKKEAERIKLEAQKLQQEVAAAKNKVEKEKQLALVAKAEAEKAKLQAKKENEKAQAAKEAAAKKLELAKKAKAQVAKERELAQKAKEQELAKQKESAVAAEQSRIKAEQEKQAQAAQAQQQAMAAQAAAARNRWIDSEFSRYVGEIGQRIKQYRTISAAFPAELRCGIQLKFLPDGSVHDVRIATSSGNAAYDAMSEAAVYKAAPFEIPEDLELRSKLQNIEWTFIAGEDSNG